MKRKDVSVAVLIVTLVAMGAVGPASGAVRDVLADTRILPPHADTAGSLGGQTGAGVALQGRLGNGAIIEAGGGGSFSVGIQADTRGIGPGCGLGHIIPPCDLPDL